MKRTVLAAGLMLSLVLAACTERLAPQGSDGAVDGALADQRVDGMLLDSTPQPDASPLSTQLQTVNDKLLLPAKAGEYAADLDGDGTAENKFGDTLSSLSTLFNMQKIIDQQLASGTLLMLAEVYGTSLSASSNASIVYYLGADSDANPADNFSGNEELAIAPAYPAGMGLAGKIASGKLQAGPGDLFAPVPFGSSPTTVLLKRAHVQADLSSAGMQNGQLNGAIPLTEIDNKVLPVLGGELTKRLNDPGTSGAALVLLKAIDKNGNKTIDVAELKANFWINSLVRSPDVDTDGDKSDDAVSIGMGFHAVTCRIQKP